MFAHLHVHTPFSFLDGATEIDKLAHRAASLGMRAIAMTDHDNVCATVKFTVACNGYGIKPILGAELTTEDGSHLTLLAKSRRGYSNLCRLITCGYANGGRLTPSLPWSSIGIKGYAPVDPAFAPGPINGLFCLSGCRKGRISSLVRARRYSDARQTAEEMRDLFGKSNFYIELQEDFTPHSRRVCLELSELAERIGVGVVATNNVHYATPDESGTHDLLRCVATKTKRDQLHPNRPLNSERYLKSEAEMASLFDWCPDASANTIGIAEQCEPALPEREDVTPKYAIPGRYADAAEYLRYLTLKGGNARYRSLNDLTMARIDHELKVICELGFADYFLMAWGIVRWARKQGILVTGRGSAADSCVAYCLTLTDVDVISRNLPFARFLTVGKVPDIDLDFPADKRDDVFRHIVNTYGEANTGMVCTFFTYWGKGAVRDFGKALSIPPGALEWLSDNLSGFISADRLEESFSRYAELKPWKGMKERFATLFNCCSRIAGFPRHIGTHSSGIVISRIPLAEIAPLQPSARGITQIWELDKDDAEEIGAIKLDVLSLRMLAAAVDAESDIVRTNPSFRYGRIPSNDQESYRMMRAGKAIGAFQFESAAQLALATSLQPEHFEDLVAAVALIRPGPIQGHVVQRFVGCRNGWMRTDILHPALAPVLAKTYGCVVFQEQVLQVVSVMTGCSEAEADRFRKSITQYTKRGILDQLKERFVRESCAYHSDFTEERALALWSQIQGWAGYGFTEGHAASFALTGYRTAYLCRHYPAEFFAGEMNHQPMGFYSANTLAAEARRRGVTVLPVDINRSSDKCFAETPESIRLGFRLVSGLSEDEIEAIVQDQDKGPFASLLEFCSRVTLHRDALENLVLCGAFDALHEHRRGLIWKLDETVGLAFSYRADAGSNGQARLNFGTPSMLATPIAWDLADFSPWDKYMWTWKLVGVTSEAHVFAWLRQSLSRRGVISTYEARRQKHGTRVTVAGLNIRPHRPHTVSGNPVLFTQIEDETEMIQAVALGEVIWQTTSIFLTSPAVVVRGIIERKGKGVMLRLEKAKPLRLQDFLEQNPSLRIQVPSTRTYPGTKLKSAADAAIV